MKVLNLYAGLGGNRKLWKDVQVTAVEIDSEIAAYYKTQFPHDEVIVGDAHEYLLKHYKEFDFIWSSPPCPTHSKVRKALAVKKRKDGTEFVQNKPAYPDMSLYQEIIFLDGFYDGLYVVENVQSYYEPLVEPQKAGRHYFWANFSIGEFEKVASSHMGSIAELQAVKGFDLTNANIKHRKDQLLRNCVLPALGLHVFNSAFGNRQQKAEALRAPPIPKGTGIRAGDRL